MPAIRSRGRTMSGPAQPKPRSDAYTGLLILSLVAQIAGAVFLYLDYSRYPASTPPKVQALAPSAGAPPGAPPGVNPPANPPVNPGANPPANPPANPGNPPAPKMP